MSQPQRQKQLKQSHKNMFRNYPESLAQPFHFNFPPLQCSEVQGNFNSDNILGASQVSWLQKLEEQSHQQGDSAVFDENRDNFAPKQTNIMKFSFNKNYPMPLSNERRDHKEANTNEKTMKEIYFNQFQKQSAKIRSVQEARKQLLSSFKEKKKIKTNCNNKQNLEGLIRKQDVNMDKNKVKNSNEIIQKIQLNRKKSSLVSLKQETKDEEAISLKYLQESLAKKGQLKIPLSKLSYLEDSNKDYSAINQTNFKVRQFDEGEEEIIANLSFLFDQLDSKREGIISAKNCNISQIREQFKIGFGYILVRVIFTDLVLNKEEFIELSLQAIKELSSPTFTNLLKSFQLKPQLFCPSKQKFTSTIKRSQSRYTTAQHNKNRNINYDVISASTSPPAPHLISTRHHNFSTTKQPDYSTIPTLRRELIEQLQNPMCQFREEHNHRKNFLSKKETQEISARYNKKWINFQSNQQMYQDYLMLLNSQSNRDLSPSTRKKIRNISEQMVNEQKRSLQAIMALNEMMEGYLIKSRRIMGQLSCEQQFYNPQPTLVNELNRNGSWPDQF